MRRRAVLLVIAPLIVLFALAAFAQPRKHGGKDKDADKAAPAGSASAQPVASGSSAAPESAHGAVGASDIGGPPPTPAATGSAPKASPLNPRANEFPDGGVAPPPADYDQLLGRIAALRSRVAALTTTLFASKVRVVVETDDDSDARISSFVVTLDDGVIYTAPKNFSAEDQKTVYDHAVAPGHHVIGVEIERFDARGKDYTTYQSSKFSVVVPEGKHVESLVRLEDDSDMASDFPDDQDGEYDLRVRLRARVVDN